MARIAVIADIHANLFALDQVIEDLARQGLDEIIVGGDLVGRGPQGSAVVARVQTQGWRSVRGNHEDYLINFRRRNIPASWVDDPHWSAARWMSDELKEEDVVYLEGLPFDLRAASDPDVLVVHGSPRSNREGIGHWTDDEDLAEILEGVEARVVVCAHTHRPLIRQAGDLLVVNVGSVGLPFNGDPRAQYAIITTGDGAPRAELRQVAYDRDALLATYETSGFLEAGRFTSALLRLEVIHARPHLVPFLKWTEITDRHADMETMAEFLSFFDPTRSLKDLFEELMGG